MPKVIEGGSSKTPKVNGVLISKGPEKFRRDRKGFQLVELLITVFVISIFMAAITDALARTYMLSSASQNQVFAATIAQELIDIARNTGYSTLSSPTNSDDAWHPVAVYGPPESNQPSYLPRSLMISGSTTAAQSNVFRGTVRQKLTNQGNGQLKLAIEVSWPAENSSSGKRLLSASSLISQFGIHN